MSNFSIFDFPLIGSHITFVGNDTVDSGIVYGQADLEPSSSSKIPGILGPLHFFPYEDMDNNEAKNLGVNNCNNEHNDEVCGVYDPDQLVSMYLDISNEQGLNDKVLSDAENDHQNLDSKNISKPSNESNNKGKSDSNLKSNLESSLKDNPEFNPNSKPESNNPDKPESTHRWSEPLKASNNDLHSDIPKPNTLDPSCNVHNEANSDSLDTNDSSGSSLSDLTHEKGKSLVDEAENGIAQNVIKPAPAPPLLANESPKAAIQHNEFVLNSYEGICGNSPRDCNPLTPDVYHPEIIFYPSLKTQDSLYTQPAFILPESYDHLIHGRDVEDAWRYGYHSGESHNRGAKRSTDTFSNMLKSVKRHYVERTRSRSKEKPTRKYNRKKHMKKDDSLYE